MKRTLVIAGSITLVAGGIAYYSLSRKKNRGEDATARVAQIKGSSGYP